MGALHGALDSQARQLAEPSGDRDQSVQPSMSGAEKNPFAPAIATTSQSLELKNEPQPDHNQLEVHSQKSTSEIRLQEKQLDAVRDLVAKLGDNYVVIETAISYHESCGEMGAVLTTRRLNRYA